MPNRSMEISPASRRWRGVLAILALGAAVQALAETSVRIGQPLRLQLVAPTAVNYEDGLQFTLVGSSEAGTVQAPLTAVDLMLGNGNTSTSGCEASDFAGFPAGNVALVQRGTCTFAIKANNAAAAGASAVLLFNQGNNASNLGLGSFGMGTGYTGGVPVFFLTYALGVNLANTTAPVVRIEAPVFRGTRHEAFLRYCFAQPAECALAVKHVNGDWTRRFNGERLQVTASTYKTLMLIAYAEAVQRGDLNPATLVPRDEWARYSVRRDGGALANAWTRLGQPASISIADMMNVMMRESDNAAPDWLLAQLGQATVRDVVQRHVGGFHDVPTSINAFFTLQDGNPLEANPGPRILAAYPGYEAAGFRQEVRDVFALMRNNATFPQQVRDYTCVALPWATVPPNCVAGFTNTTAQLRQIFGRYFTRSNPNTYLRLMEGLLDGSLVSPATYALMQPHLEFRMQLSPPPTGFVRYGGKGGSFGPQNLCNWTGFVETTGGERVVVAAMVRDSLHTCADIFPVTFMEQMALDATFRVRVRDAPEWDDEVHRAGFEPVTLD